MSVEEQDKERHIRFGINGIACFKVCGHIKIDAREVDEYDVCEYTDVVIVRCMVCRKTYRFVEHVN